MPPPYGAWRHAARHPRQFSNVRGVPAPLGACKKWRGRGAPRQLRSAYRPVQMRGAPHRPTPGSTPMWLVFSVRSVLPTTLKFETGCLCHPRHFSNFPFLGRERNAPPLYCRRTWGKSTARPWRCRAAHARRASATTRGDSRGTLARKRCVVAPRRCEPPSCRARRMRQSRVWGPPMLHRLGAVAPTARNVSGCQRSALRRGRWGPQGHARIAVSYRASVGRGCSAWTRATCRLSRATCRISRAARTRRDACFAQEAR